MRKQGNLTQDDINAKVEYLYTHRANHTIHAYIDITGDLIAGTLLSQIMYWFSKGKNNEVRASIYRDGHYWIAKRREDWYGEIRVSPKQYDRAISMLSGKIKVDGKEKIDESKRFVEVRKFHFNGIPTTHIRPITENINKAISAWKQNLADEIANTNCRVEDVNSPNVNIENADGEIPNIPMVNMEVNEESNSYNIYNNINNIDTENTTDTTNRDYHSENTVISPTELNTDKSAIPLKGLNTSLSDERKAHGQSKDKWVVTKNHIVSVMDKLGYGELADETQSAIEIFRYYYARYRIHTGNPHPRLNDKTMTDTLRNFIMGSDEVSDHDIDTYEMLIDEHFKNNYGMDIDWSIRHFMTEDVRNKLYCRVR